MSMATPAEMSPRIAASATPIATIASAARASNARLRRAPESFCCMRRFYRWRFRLRARCANTVTLPIAHLPARRHDVTHEDADPLSRPAIRRLRDAAGRADLPGQAGAPDRAVPGRRTGRHLRALSGPGHERAAGPAGGDRERQRTCAVCWASTVRRSRRPTATRSLLISSSAVSIGPFAIAKMPFDPTKDLSLITTVVRVPEVLAVNPSLPVNTLAELIAYAKANPGKVNYGSAGSGSITHLAGELLKVEAGIDVVHVPYKGAAPAVQRPARRPGADGHIRRAGAAVAHSALGQAEGAGDHQRPALGEPCPTCRRPPNSATRGCCRTTGTA